MNENLGEKGEAATTFQFNITLLILSVLFTKIGEKRGNFYQGKWRDLQMKGTFKNTELNFDDHRCLSWSEDSKCLWTHGKNGTSLDQKWVNVCELTVKITPIFIRRE